MLWGEEITEVSENDVFDFKEQLDNFHEEIKINSEFEYKNIVENVKHHFELDDSSSDEIEKSVSFLIFSLIFDKENITIQGKKLLDFLVELPEKRNANVICWYLNLLVIIYTIYSTIKS